MIEAYPLNWPDGWPRRKPYQRNPSKYKTTFLRARDELVRELHTGRARNVVVSTNTPLRRDGLPLANMRELTLEHHPDQGGSSEVFSRITQAYHEAIGATS